MLHIATSPSTTLTAILQSLIGPHLVLLADTMGAILGLQILVWVPIRVEDDDSVGRLQVEAETSGTRGQQEEEVLAGGVEQTQEFPSILRLGHT